MTYMQVFKTNIDGVSIIESREFKDALGVSSWVSPNVIFIYPMITRR